MQALIGIGVFLAVVVGVALLAAALAAYLLLAAAVTVGTAAAGTITLGLALIGVYLMSARQVLAPPAAPPGTQVRQPDTSEPAYRSYYCGQVATDLQAVITESRQRITGFLHSRAVRGTRRRLLSGPARGQWTDPDAWRWQLAVSVPAGLGLAAATGIALALALAVIAAIQVTHLAFLAAVTGVLAAAGAAALAADWLIVTIRGIRLRCPHPGCYRRISLPYYTCPSGQHQHRKLRPGRYGVLSRVCSCGRQMPTLLALRRHQLGAVCPSCLRQLPQGAGSAPLVHIALAGGTSAGKSTFLTAMVANLEWLAGQKEITVEFASPDSRRDYLAARALLESGAWPHKTSAVAPYAFMLYVKAGPVRRLVYLYDPMGETFREADTIREQHYLDGISGIIMVIDPFAAPALQGTRADDAVVRDARPSPESPDATYARVAAELGVLLGGSRSRVPVAVVATKIDAVEQARGLAGPPGGQGAPVAGWLAEIGLGNMVRSLGHDFHQVRYWAVSASASLSTEPPPGCRRAVAAPVLWLLGRP